ncbi:hypothetical protein FAF44_04710 [Nonomuraea sp. MG754425]|uniref:hypothetical protein n=1 Tax=Nonomuraea sp. MG754425 TaxID=2570319 RepID=UPI001F33145C|nr:hypothetical protein [Nonomuraea sp. MG754425]MCF6467715.1 hypothetical protein [Nonomuraea sp. MG754425]
MSLDSLSAHYGHLLQGDGSWLAEGLAWTVVVPDEGALSSEEIAARLLGGDERPSLTICDIEEASEGDVAIVEQAGRAAMIVDFSGAGRTWDEDILSRLSAGAQVWHVSWEVTRNSRLIHAAHGHVVTRIPHLEPVGAPGADVSFAGTELTALARTLEHPWPATQAMAMAIVEARTGAHLDSAWLGSFHPVVPVGG